MGVQNYSTMKSLVEVTLFADTGILIEKSFPRKVSCSAITVGVNVSDSLRRSGFAVLIPRTFHCKMHLVFVSSSIVPATAM